MKKVNLFLFVFLALVLFFCLIYFILKVYFTYSVLDVRTIEYNVSVGDYVGLNLDSDKLNFGTVFPSGFSSRGLTLQSNVDGYVFIKSDFDWLLVDKQGIFVEKGSIVNLMFKVEAPHDAFFGDYQGVIYIYILKHNNYLSSLFFDSGDLVDVFEGSSKGGAQLSINITD